jgi:methyl-accepting chemotaxis protein
VPPVPGTTSSTKSLSRRIVLWTGVALFLTLAALAWVGSRLVRDRILRDADSSVLQAAEQAELVIDRVVAERERQVRLLASLPDVVDAARLGSERATQLGLVGQPLEVAEQRFDSTRSLNVDPRTRRFLLDRAASLDLAEVLLTDVHGFNAITTERTSDFVQSDEASWQQAMSRGITPAEASYDESAQQVSIGVSGAVRERDSAPAVGVLKVVYGLGALQEAVNDAATQEVLSVELIDAAGLVIASSTRPADLKPLPGRETLPAAGVGTIVEFNDGSEHRASVRNANGNAWRVVAHTPQALVSGELSSSYTMLGLGALAVFLVLAAALAAMNTFMTKRIAMPAATLAGVVESVAGGNLGVRVTESTADDEIGRLGRATSKMVGGLRALTIAIKGSAKETAGMAMDLTASSEEMAASSQEIAQTSVELSRQSAEMAHTIQEMLAGSSRLVELSAALTAGVTEGVKRNEQLRALARENGQRLIASARELEVLVGEVQSSTAAAEALAAASQEIREFVELVQYMARQSKLLAFSASMEASRAGESGAGFAVVAKEVQRLADGSSEAAEKTEKVVTALLQKVEETRATSSRTAVTVERVRRTTQHGLEAFGHVEAAVADTEAWTSVVEQASVTSSSVAQDTTHRLDALARGTEAFAQAMEEVAASAEEQSASTEEIASTAANLAATAEKLTDQAGAFRLEG